MQIYKVIRIGINSDLFFDKISSDVTEYWFNFEDVLSNDFLLNYLKQYENDALNALQNKTANFISVYSDI